MNLKRLKKEIPYKWRVQSYSKYKPMATCVAYIDARDAMDLLDEVVGEANWQVKYSMIGERLLAGIGIAITNDNGEREWVWKWDTGAETDIEIEKGIISDAFKRAGVHWGIGRFLYSKKIQYVKANKVKSQGVFPYVIDESGNRVYDLTKYINDREAQRKEQVLANAGLTEKQVGYLERMLKSHITSEKERNGIKDVLSSNNGKRASNTIDYLSKKEALLRWYEKREIETIALEPQYADKTKKELLDEIKKHTTDKFVGESIEKIMDELNVTMERVSGRWAINAK